MLQRFYPDEYVKSTYDIDFKKLYHAGIRGVLFDVDNTLVPHGAPADEKSKKLFYRLHQMGMRTCLISNNRESRVKPFAEAVESPYIFRANKPFLKNYRKAMKLMGTDKDHTVFVGDQLFTDVCGAKRMGIRSILVKPINPKEEIQIVLKRCPEKIVLFFYKKKEKKG